MSPLGLLGGEKATVDVVEGGCGELIIACCNELHTDFVEIEWSVAVVCNDDAHGDEGVADIRQAEEVTLAGLGAGVDGNGDMLLLVRIECGVL